MASHNDITGDALVSRPSSKEFNENFDRIFGVKKTNGGWKPPLKPLQADPLCKICGKGLGSTKECAWTGCPLNWDESRADTIGQNGNEGLHYKEDK